MKRFFAIALLASIACNDVNGGEPTLAPVPNTPATLKVDVGTGASNWLPVHDGDTVAMTFGSQGGFHVWTSIRIMDASVETVRINLSTRIEGTGDSAGPPSSVATNLTLTSDGAREHDGMRNFIADASAVRGKRVILRAEAVAPDGRHGAGEHVVVLQ